MKKIVLIGDSIRMGYDKYVKESMENIAEVYFPAANCCFAQFILRYLHMWIADELGLEHVDAVHWNAGLWDTLRIYGDTECLAPLDAYVSSITKIDERIKYMFPNAVSIFATSTPVLEDGGYIKEFEMRYNADIERYNAAACEALSKRGVIINDLHALLKDCPESYHSDQTHFYTADATALIGNQVTKVLCEALDLDASGLILPDKEKYHRHGPPCTDADLYVKKGNFYVLKRDK